jgi:hypothetical protein
MLLPLATLTVAALSFAIAGWGAIFPKANPTGRRSFGSQKKARTVRAHPLRSPQIVAAMQSAAIALAKAAEVKSVAYGVKVHEGLMHEFGDRAAAAAENREKRDKNTGLGAFLLKFS